MSRPARGNLTPVVTVIVSGGSRTVTVAPAARSLPRDDPPTRFEWFRRAFRLSLALFYKAIATFVQVSRETRPVNTSGCLRPC